MVLCVGAHSMLVYSRLIRMASHSSRLASHSSRNNHSVLFQAIPQPVALYQTIRTHRSAQ